MEPGKAAGTAGSRSQAGSSEPTAPDDPFEDSEQAEEWAREQKLQEAEETRAGRRIDIRQVLIDDKVSSVRLGAALIRAAPAARDLGGRLYAYYKGAKDEFAWHPNGEEHYRGLIKRVLGIKWHREIANGAINWIEQELPVLAERPPLDRVRVWNGIIRIADGSYWLEDPTQELMSPVCLPWRFDPDEDCPEFLKFLVKLQPDPRLRAVIQELAGLLLVPDNSQQKAFLFYGPGGIGKSALIMILEALVGEANCSSVRLSDMGSNRFATAVLHGKLLNTFADLPYEELASTTAFDMITGRDAIQAEHKYGKSFRFRPYARLLFSANRYPPIRNPGTAHFERWAVLPFRGVSYRNTPEDNKHLAEDIIEAELSGVANWALNGLLRLRKRGMFTSSRKSQAALERFRVKADQVVSFIAERRDSAAPTRFWMRRELYGTYKLWCGESGHQPVGRNQFYERVAGELGDFVLGGPNADEPGWTL